MSQGNEQPTPPSANENLQGDAAPTSGEGVKSNVELDLDDAPFLEESTDVEPEETNSEEATAEVEIAKTEEKKSLKDKLLANKKKLVILIAALLLLIVGAVAGIMFFSGSKPEEPKVEVVDPTKEETKEEAKAETTEEIQAVDPSLEPDLVSIEWEAFWVPLTDPQGNPCFLVCEVVLTTKNKVLEAEFHSRQVSLRDVVYFYLHRQPYMTLTQNISNSRVQEDLLQILNENLQSGTFQDLYLKNYYIIDP